MFEYIYKIRVMRMAASILMDASTSRFKHFTVIQNDPSLAILGHIVKLAYEDSVPTVKHKVGSRPSLQAGSYLVICMVMEWMLAQKDKNTHNDAAFLVRFLCHPRLIDDIESLIPSRLNEVKAKVGVRSSDGEYKFTEADKYAFSVVDSYMFQIKEVTSE